MKALLLTLCLIPTMTFAIDNKCEKEISPTEKLIYKVNTVLLSPYNANGEINRALYLDIIAKNKFAAPKAEIEQYAYAETKRGVTQKTYWNLYKVYTYSSGDMISTTKTFNHKDLAALDSKKKELSALVSEAVNALPLQNNNALALVLKDGSQVMIDFRLPMLANPVVNYTKEKTVQLYSISSGYPYLNEPNSILSAAFNENKYAVEECDEKVYTKLTTKEKVVLGIKVTTTSTEIVDTSNNIKK